MAVELIDPFDSAMPPPPPAPRAAPAPDANGFIDPFDTMTAPAVPKEVAPASGIFEARQAAPLDQLKIAGKMFVTMDSAAQADMIKATLPEAEIEQDKDGRFIVNYKGERGYLNGPGVDRRDLFDFANTVVKYLPAGKLATKGATWFTRALLGGVASGATSVSEDVAAGKLGSEQGISGSRAGLATTGGALAEVAVPAFQALLRTKTAQATGQWAAQYLKPMQEAGLVIEGKLTGAGVEFVRKLGLDPKAISTRLTTALRQSVDDAIDPAAVPMDARSRMFNVPISRGQALNDDAMQALERNIAAADVSTGGGQKMTQFFDDQASKMIGETGESGAGLVQSELSGGNPLLTASSGRSARGTLNERIAQAGDTLVDRVPEKAAAAKAAANAKYKAAESYDVLFEPEAVRQGIIGARKAMREGGLDRAAEGSLTPVAAKIDQRLGKLVRWLKPREGKLIRPIDLRMIERERQRINKALSANGVRGTTDERALLAAKGSIDDWLDQAVEDSIFDANPAALDVLKSARGLWAEYKQLYSGKGATGKLMEAMANRTATPSQVIDGVFGAGQIGGKQTTVETLGRLKQIFGESSDEWAMMREAAWLRVLQKSVVSSGKSEKFQIGRFLSSYDEAFSGKGRDVMKTLFSPDEMKYMDEFYQFARDLQVPDKVGNPSKSGYAIAQMLQQVAPKMGIAADLSGMSSIGSIISVIGRRTGGKIDWRAAVAGAPRVPYNPAMPRAVAVAGALNAPDAAAELMDQDGQ